MDLTDEDVKIIEEGIEKSPNGFFEYGESLFWKNDDVLCQTTKEVYEEVGKYSVIPDKDKEWWINMAKLEDGCEIGAGFESIDFLLDKMN